MPPKRNATNNESSSDTGSSSDEMVEEVGELMGTLPTFEITDCLRDVHRFMSTDFVNLLEEVERVGGDVIGRLSEKASCLLAKLRSVFPRASNETEKSVIKRAKSLLKVIRSIAVY